MTVGELIEILENYDTDMQVIIGMQQTYGSDFAMEISDISERKITAWHEDDFNAIVITEGGQFGIVDYEEDF